jgi:hypothetical protein
MVLVIIIVDDGQIGDQSMVDSGQSGDHGGRSDDWWLKWSIMVVGGGHIGG